MKQFAQVAVRTGGWGTYFGSSQFALLAVFWHKMIENPYLSDHIKCKKMNTPIRKNLDTSPGLESLNFDSFWTIFAHIHNFWFQACRFSKSRFSQKMMFLPKSILTLENQFWHPKASCWYTKWISTQRMFFIEILMLAQSPFWIIWPPPLKRLTSLEVRTSHPNPIKNLNFLTKFAVRIRISQTYMRTLS